MFKQELPLMYPNDAETQLVKAHMWDPFEYLMARKRDGLLKTDFPESLGNISYQIPCHGRVQNIGKKTEEMLKMIPDTTINTIERLFGACGHLWCEKSHPCLRHEDWQACGQSHGHHEGWQPTRLHQF
jgi:Fe-S oxidoreductase